MSLYAIAKREVDALTTPTEQPPPEPAGGGPVATAVLEPTPPARLAGAAPVGTTGVVWLAKDLTTPLAVP